MAREAAGYRLNLERVDEAFDHEMLNVAEIARWLGCSPYKVRKDFCLSKSMRRISKAELARQMTS